MRLGARALIGSCAAVAAAAALVTAPAAGASPDWAAAGKASIRPGGTITIAGIDCVTGFLLTDGTRVFVSVPTSCTGVNDGRPTDECSAAQVPYGTPARISGARYEGHVVYSSATEMQLRGTKRPARCAHNSLALVKLDRRDIRRANPSVLGIGGPRGVAWTAPAQGARLTVCVQSTGMPGTMLQNDTAWAYQVMVDAPMPIDKGMLGGPVMTSSGRALGLLTLTPQTQVGPATVSDFGRELRFLQTVRGFGDVHLANGTVRFRAA